MVYQWSTAGDTPPTTSQYSADTRSTCYSAAGEGELNIRSANFILINTADTRRSLNE